jgi:hypothetical protein
MGARLGIDASATIGGDVMGRSLPGAVCAAALLATGQAQAQTGLAAPKPWSEPSANPRDLTGVYSPAPGIGRLRPVDGSDPPFQPWAKAENDRRVEGERTNKPVVNTTTRCLPSGTPRIMTAPYPMMVLNGPRQVVFLFEVQHLMRFVYLDETHPGEDDLYPTFMGHSVGRWEGDTLVIDTVGLTDQTSLDQYDLPKSGELHVVERIRKINGGKQLEDLITIDDPKAYTRPWTARTLYNWRPEIRFMEYVCEENNRNPVDANGVVGVELKSGK